MCCCASPNVNGQPGYRWNFTDPPGVHRVAPPALAEGEALIFDEPGRCGGQDSHCHHYRVVGGRFPSLLVRHGGGEERIRLSNGVVLCGVLADLDTHGRYWLLNAIYHAHADARGSARELEAARWRRAAAEKRIKLRKVRGSAAARVEIREGS